MITDGGNRTAHTSEIAYMPVPTEAEWPAILADADATRGRTLRLYSPEEIKERVATGELAIYEMRQDGARLGSMALEHVKWNTRDVINVVWLKVEAGRFGKEITAGIRECWRRIAVGLDAPQFVVNGRAGWEHILISQGLEPTKLSSLWIFDSGRL